MEGLKMEKLSGKCGIKTMSNWGGIVIKIDDSGDCLEYQWYDDEIVRDVKIDLFTDTDDVLGYDDGCLYAGFKIGDTVHFLGEFMRVII
jgi:hypothetical protein